MDSLRELLLLKDLRPDGPTQVSSTARPYRLAYLIDPVDQSSALAAIESACLTWDGIHQFLIPCTPGESPDPVWTKVLEIHDPDALVDLVGARSDFTADQHDRWDRSTYRWEHPTTTMDVTGAVVFSALARWKRTRPKNASYGTINLHPLANHQFALPLAFRFGHLDQRPIEPMMIMSMAYDAARVEDFVDVLTIDPSNLDDSELAQLMSQIPFDFNFSQYSGRTGVWHDLSLPGLTDIGLPRRQPGYYNSGAFHPEHEQHDEAFLERLVVVGSADSVPDLCLAWNLRAQCSAEWRFPLWIPANWLHRADVSTWIDRARGITHEGLAERRKSRDVHLVSASLSSEALETLAANGPSDFIVHDCAALDHFFSADFQVGVTNDIVVNFRRGVAAIPHPDFSSLGDWHQAQRGIWSVETEDYHLPRGSSRDFGYPPAGRMVVRWAKDGQEGLTDIDSNQTGSLQKIGIQDSWAIVQGVAKRAGFRAEIGEKGQLAIATMNLLGNDRSLRLLASSLVYKLLRAMAEIIPRQAIQRSASRILSAANVEDTDSAINTVMDDVSNRGQFDRQHWNRSRIGQFLGTDVKTDSCDELVRWLVERRIVFQGYEFKCPTCGVRRWYPIARLSDTQTCDGCQNITVRPATVDSLQWSYRLNEAVGQAIDQGILPHLLAVNRMAVWKYARRAPLLGLLPSLVFSSLDGSIPQVIEVDLFAIKGGRVNIGECKAGEGVLTASEVERFSDLGRKLDCSRIIYALAAPADKDADVLSHARMISSPIVVEAWDHDGLFDWDLGITEKLDAPTYLTRRLQELHMDN